MLASLPALGTEIGATYKGLKQLKSLGASPEALAAARGTLGRAFGTYGASTAMNVGTGLLGLSAGRALRQRAERKRREEEALQEANADA